MTAHEVLTSLFWLVILAYGLYLGWFATATLRNAKRPLPLEHEPIQPSPHTTNESTID